jgi:hypothetical protein
MKKTLVIVLIVLIVGVGGFYVWQNLSNPQQTEQPKQSEQTDEALIRVVVEDFGKSLKNVSLQAPKETAIKSIEENYKDFITPQLLDTWKADPSKALGRFVSSPWPDRIEIQEITKINDTQYLVKGKIIEITSVEEIEGGVTNERDVEISVIKSNDKWLINDVSSISHIDTSNWQNSTQSMDQGEISFKYPQDLPASYISVQEWPPKIEITDNEFNCPETSSQDGSVEIITNKIINGKTYCVRATNEGAAGSIYTIYFYSTPLDNKLLTLNFVLKYPNCENYDDSQKTQCFQERQSFDLDNLIDQIVRTIKLN